VRRSARLLTGSSCTAALLVLPLAGAAAAHPTVQGEAGAAAGDYTTLSLRVPTERDVATTAVEIELPQDTPLASVRVQPQPGWTYALTTGAPSAPLEVHGRAVEEVVQRVTWTATAGGTGPTEFEQFVLSIGPLPETDQLHFPVLQTHADGEVARWVDAPLDGSEPKMPAPVLELSVDEAVAEHALALQREAEATGGASSAAAGTDSSPSAVSWAALAVGAAALVTSLLALRSRRAG
jgi:uncharacterized protein YcnI